MTACMVTRTSLAGAPGSIRVDVQAPHAHETAFEIGNAICGPERVG